MVDPNPEIPQGLNAQIADQFATALKALGLEGQQASEALRTIAAQLDLIKTQMGAIPKDKALTKTYQEARKAVQELQRDQAKYFAIFASEKDKEIAKIRKNLDEELRLIQRNFDAQMSQKGLNKKEITEIERERQTRTQMVRGTAADKEKQISASPGFIQNVGAGLLEKLMGPVVALGTAAGLVTAIVSALAIGQEVIQNEFKLGKTVLGITGGIGGVGAGNHAYNTAFGDLAGSGGINQIEGSRALVQLFSQAPMLIEQKLTPVLNPLLAKTGSLEQSLKMMGESSATAGMQVSHMHEAINIAEGTTKKFRYGFIQTFEMITGLTASIKRGGADVGTATDQASEWTYAINNAASSLGLSSEELKRFGGKISSALGSLSPTHAFGLVQAVTGKQPGGWTDISNTISSPKFSQQLFGMFRQAGGPGFLGEAASVETYGKAIGIGSMDVQTARAISETLKNLKPGQDALKELRGKNIEGDHELLAASKESLRISAGALEIIKNIIVGVIAPAAVAVSHIYGLGGQVKDQDVRMLNQYHRDMDRRNTETAKRTRLQPK